MGEDKKPLIHVGTIGHIDKGKVTLQEAISKYIDKTDCVTSSEECTREIVQVKVKKQLEHERLLQQATIMSLLLANVDDLIDTDWDALLGRKQVPQKGHVMRPIRHYRRK